MNIRRVGAGMVLTIGTLGLFVWNELAVCKANGCDRLLANGCLLEVVVLGDAVVNLIDPQGRASSGDSVNEIPRCHRDEIPNVAMGLAAEWPLTAITIEDPASGVYVLSVMPVVTAGVTIVLTKGGSPERRCRESWSVERDSVDAVAVSQKVLCYCSFDEDSCSISLLGD